MLKLVPFNASWISHDKLDLHAIYKRPRYVRDELDQEAPERDANGQPVYDITSPLPVRQHNKWSAKGFVYVTLATRGDLRAAAEKGTIEGDWRQYDQHQSGGPWHSRMYAKGQEAGDTTYMDELRADVRAFGSAAVEAIRKRMDPHFVLPSSLKGVLPGTGGTGTTSTGAVGREDDYVPDPPAAAPAKPAAARARKATTAKKVAEVPA